MANRREGQASHPGGGYRLPLLEFFLKRPAGIEGWFNPTGPAFRLFAVLAFLIFLISLPLLIIRVKFPGQVGQGEAINVEFALTLLRGDPLYHDPSQAPYLYPAYPPLYPWLASLLMGWIHNVWAPGRILAFTGYLGCGGMLWFIGAKRWGWPAALLLSSLFWLFPTWARWGTMNRCDAFGLFLQFLAFLLLYQEEFRKKPAPEEGAATWGTIVLAGFLEALAILVKQTSMGLLVVFALYGVGEKRWKPVLLFALSCLLPVGVVFGIEQWQSGGFFLKNIFLWLDTGTSIGNLTYYFFHFFTLEGGVLLVLVIFLVRTRELNNLLRWQVFFSALMLLDLARAMSAENYFMEFLLYGIFLVGEGLASARKEGLRIQWLPKSWPPALIPFCLLVLVFAGDSRIAWPGLPSEQEIDMKWNAATVIYRNPGEHLALDLDLPVMAGKRLWVQPAEYTAMVKRGYWSAEPLIRDIREKKFATIELYDLPQQYLLPEAVVAEVKNNYHVKIREFGRLWYVPNG